MSASSPVDPHDKMRARDVNKVARGEQAPRPAHEYGTVSPPPPTGPTFSEDELHYPLSDRARHCYARYIENIRCRHERGKKSRECEMFAKQHLSRCPVEWIERWDKERAQCIFPAPI